MSGQRILVVGGAGYIGSHVAKALRDHGSRPVVYDNLSSGSEENILTGVDFVRGDILDSDALKQALKGVDGVVHLAALKAAGESMKVPERYAHNNIVGTINLLNAMLEVGVETLVFSSSAAVYGEPVYTPMDEKHPTNPTNFYGYTKLEIERLLAWYAKLRGLRFASLRYFNAAGYDPDGEVVGLERNPANLLPIVLEAIVGKREGVQLFGDDYATPDGTCIRDYVHVTDLAEAHVKSLHSIQSGGGNLTLNLGTSRGLSVLEILEKARVLSGVDFEVTRVPRRPGDPDVVLASAEQARKVLDWEPRFSSSEVIIDSMLRVYRGLRAGT